MLETLNRIWKKLKERWGIKSNFQVLLILIVFAVTGSLSLYVSRFIFDILGIGDNTTMWVKAPVYILTVFPAYQILLIIVGTLLGQGKFFINFQKKVFERMFRRTSNGKS